MGSKRQRIVVDPQTLAHLQGKHLEAPSSVIPELEEAHGPNKILHGKFKGRDKDPSHKDCVLVKFKEDPRTFFFDIEQVYEWIKEPKDGKAESLDAEPSGTGCTLPSQEGQPPGGGGQPPAEERDGGGEGEPQREEPAPVKKKRGRPPIGYIAPGEESPLAGMAVMVPTSVLHALESVHGPGKWLNGKVKGRDKDPLHPNCVLVKCREDKRTFFFDSDQVQEWITAGERGLLPAQPTRGLDAPRPKVGRPSRASQDPPPVQPPQQSQPPLREEAPLLRPKDEGGMDLGREEEQEEEEEGEEVTADGSMGRWVGKRQRLDIGKRPPPHKLLGEPINHPPPTSPPKRGSTSKAEVADIIGKEVEIPGYVFHDYTPGYFIRGRVLGPDSAHASAVELRLLSDKRRLFYFHASEVRDWLRMQQLRAVIANQSDQGTLSDTLAAEVLARMSGGPGRGSSPTTSGHTSPHPSARHAAPGPHQAPWPNRHTDANGCADAAERGGLPGSAQSPPPQHRAALRSSAINYAAPMALPSLEYVGEGGEGAPPSGPPPLPVLRHPLPAQRRQRQREMLAESAAAAAAGGEGDGQGAQGGGEAAQGADASGQAAAGESVLQWGATEVIAQRASLLPPALVAQLVRIGALHDAKMEALAQAEQTACQIEQSMQQQLDGEAGAQQGPQS